MGDNTESGQQALDDAYAILQSITDAFYSVNESWNFTFVNRQTELLLGRTADELIGKNIWDLYPSLLGSEFETLYRGVAASRVPSTVTSFYADHGRWYEVRAYPATHGLSIYFRDATKRIMTEQTLRESETRFRVMANAIPQIVWIADAANNIEFFNRQWSLYSGVSRNPANAAEFIGQHVHADDRAQTVQAWEQALREGSTFNVEHRMMSASGEYRWFLVRAEPYRNPESGEIVRWFGTSTDVHDHKKTEAALRYSETRYRTLFNSIDEGFCIIEMIFDDDGEAIDYRFCQTNAPFQEQTGLYQAEGKTMLELAPTHEAHWFAIYGKVARTGEPVRFENEAKALHRWYDVYAFKVSEEGDAKVAVLFNDISERKRIEREMQRAARSKDEFLAMLAHELRNPLAPIAAASDLLRRAPSDATIVRQTGDIIARQVGYMSALVDDLLDVSRVTSGLITLDTTTLDVKRIVSDAVEQVRPLIESRGHHLVVHTPPESAHVHGDAKRLVQVVANLLNNAAKYTPLGGGIELRVEVQNPQVLIAVKDSGIGMTPDFLVDVFDMFSQAARTADRSQGGLGIGLALVKSLVELHHGSVTAQSKGLGEGSEFTVCLPRVSPPHRSSVPANEDRPGSAPVCRLRLMVVDDNIDAAVMIAMFLQAEGHEVIIEHDARRVLERARNERPDLYLLDIGLPEINGNELARQLRAQPESASAVLIALTGYGQEQDKQSTAAAGFDHHFVKPVDAMRLAKLLAELGAAKGGGRG